MSCEETMDHVADGSAPPSPWPSGIILNRKDRTLELAWHDVRVSLSHKVLRQSCRCSMCESMRRELDDVIPVDAGVELVKMEMLGSIGVQLFFSDKHERGIYPWAYLRRIADGRVEAGFTESLMKGWSDE